MNTAAAPPPESGQFSTSQQRPFFYAQPTAQLPFPNPWYLSQLYNPYCIPGPGFRGGNPYYPYYSIPLHEFPGFYVPQHQMNLRMNRRPHFNPHPPSPMFYHATRLRHYASPGRRTETKETQTDPKQPECTPKKHLGTENKDTETANAVSHSSGISTENDQLEGVEMSMSPVTTVPERDFPKNACNAAQYRNMPPGSYAYEKEEVRIEYGSGSPAAIQMWKSYKETIPIYDVAVVKEIPENVVQRDLFCEGVLYGPPPEEEIAVQSISYGNTEECKQLPPSKLCLDTVQGTETQTPLVQGRETRPEQTKQAKQYPKKATLDGEPQSVLLEHVEVSHPIYDVEQSDSQDSEENDASESSSDDLLDGLEMCPDKGSHGQSVCNGEMKMANTSVWVDESLQKFIPSPAWVAWIENQESNFDYDVYMSQRKQKRPSVLSVTSDELSSRDEGSSLDNGSVSYFVPDYMLRKGLYAFRRNAEGSEKEKIQSSGSLKEDGLTMKHASSQFEQNSCPSGQKVKNISSRNRKFRVPIRGLTKRKLYSLKKKPRKSQSLSEPEDSEEYWVVEDENSQLFEEEESDEEEYYFQEDLPHEKMDFGKTNFFKQIAQQRILWKPPKEAFPAQIIGWPVKGKQRVKKTGLSEAFEQVYKLKPCDYPNYKRPERGYKEVTELKKSLQKTGGKPQKKASGATVEEYWVGRGARPKFPEPAYYLQDTTKIKEQDKPPKKKGTRKSSKRKQSRADAEVEAWEIPKTLLYRGHSLRKGGTRK